MDLSGKLIIKARLGDDVRRIPIHNEDLTYDELILMMQRVFRNTLKPSDEIVIKYADEDGDLITIFDDSDITLAIQLSRILKLTIQYKNDVCEGIVAPSLKNLRNELVVIRNRVNLILDSLSGEDSESQTKQPRETGSTAAQEAAPESPRSAPAATSLAKDSGSSDSKLYNSSMFDPLTNATKSASGTLTAFTGARETISSPTGSVASKTSTDPMAESQPPPPGRPQSTQNVVQSSFEQSVPLQNDYQQNSLHHTNHLQSSFGDAALGGPQPGLHDQKAPQVPPNQYQQNVVAQPNAQGKPVGFPPQPASSQTAAQLAPGQSYGQYNSQQPMPTKPMPQAQSQYSTSMSRQQDYPGSTPSNLPAATTQYGYNYSPSISQNPYPTQANTAQQYQPASANSQSYRTQPTAQYQQPQHPYGGNATTLSSNQQYHSATPPAQAYPPPGAPGVNYPNPAGYQQTTSPNPHRLIRSGPGYRARQPGPGYQ